MKKANQILAGIVSLSLLFSFTGCSSGTEPTTAVSDTSAAGQDEKGSENITKDEEGKVYELSMNTTYDVNSPMCIAAQKFCDDVGEASKGRLKINLFTNSALGSGKESYIALAGNELDMLVEGCLGLDMYAPAYSFLSAPYLFEDMEHVRAVMESKLGEGMKEDLLEDNIRTVALGYRAPRVTSSNRPIQTPDDLNGLKMRVSEMSSWVSIWGSDGLGATSISIALGELYSSLQSGVVEASEGPYEQLATYKLYEVQDYVIDTNHVFEWVGMFMSDKAYQSLPVDLQQMIEEYAEKDFAEYCTKLSEESSQEYLQELLDNGMTLIEPDRDAFRQKAMDSYNAWFKDTWIVTDYDEVMSYAK